MVTLGDYGQASASTSFYSDKLSSSSSDHHDDGYYEDDTDDIEPLRCWECNVNFNEKKLLYDHLHLHIKQPVVSLDRVTLPSLKLTIKNSPGNGFEIIHSPTTDYNVANLAALDASPQHDAAPSDAGGAEEDALNFTPEDDSCSRPLSGVDEEPTEINEALVEEDVVEEEQVSSPEIDETIENEAPTPLDNDDGSFDSNFIVDDDDDNDVTSATAGTPPPSSPQESSSSSMYAKIRIKTTGLLEEPQPISITEITSDSEINESNWAPSVGVVEDPLKLPTSISDDSSLMSLLNNNERAKDLGFTTSDTEFISMDRLDDHNRTNNAMQLYQPPSSMMGGTSSFGGLAGLPMEALAQQVSRLQPPAGNNGMHQQNVLINIQQFPQPPAPPTYQPPPMYHPPMYHQPYQPYQPPNPMYYPPPGMPGGFHHPPQQQQQQLGPPRPPMVVPTPHYNTGRPQGPRPGLRAPGNPTRATVAPPQPRMPMMRQRMPTAMMGPRQQHQRPMNNMQQNRMIRPKGTPYNVGNRPRMNQNMNSVAINNNRQQQAVKRSSDSSPMGGHDSKKNRFDVLTPDKDDEDCQVICMQPNNKDGALPQIQSVQGGTSDQSEANVMHLSDSITLSVRKRNSQPRPPSPKNKSDTKAVANILATRGITVTAAPKSKDNNNSANLPSTSLNLNGAVSIIPSSSGKSSSTSNNNNSGSGLPTVDLTDDDGGNNSSRAKAANKVAVTSTQQTKPRMGLPFRCDLCPAQYPNALGLIKHRQNYHKTSGGMCDIGIPLVNLKQPGIFQKLTSLGIFNYIPLPSTEGTFALPIINSRNANVAGLGATTMLTLGPIRSIPKTANNGHIMNNNTPKQLHGNNNK